MAEENTPMLIASTSLHTFLTLVSLTGLQFFEIPAGSFFADASENRAYNIR